MEGYNKVDYCLGDKVMSTIYFNYKTDDVICENFTDNVFDCAMLSGKHTWDELLEFMEERTFPHTRANVKSLVSHLGLQYYDALESVHVMDKDAIRTQTTSKGNQSKWHTITLVFIYLTQCL